MPRHRLEDQFAFAEGVHVSTRILVGWVDICSRSQAADLPPTLTEPQTLKSRINLLRAEVDIVNYFRADTVNAEGVINE